MRAGLAMVFVLCHGLAIVLLPAQATPLSFCFLIAAPLLAGWSCLRRAHGDAAAMGWRAAAIAMLLWAGGMALNMLDALTEGDPSMTPRASLLLYVIYGVPLIFILARARQEPLGISLIDAALAALLGVLFFFRTLLLANSADSAAGMVDLALMFDIQNAFIAAFALVRLASSDEPARRQLFKALSLYAVSYLLIAGYFNHHASDGTFGSVADVLVGVPFLSLAVAAARRGPSSPATPPAQLVRLVHGGGPMILPLLLLIVATLIVDSARGLAITGFIAAIVGFGLRSTLLQAALLEQQEELARQARRDGLTGIANRRGFDEALQLAWARGGRAGSGLGLLLIDIDHFKAYNDVHGHPAGDRCLRTVARVLADAAAPAGYTVARYGGEEFAVIVPDTTPDEAVQLAERIRASVVTTTAAMPPAAVTVSIGVGRLSGVGAQGGAALIAAADAALYEAKRGGRNRVVVATTD
jgi:diguanylate cyclase (GGDEF)-like protein